MTIGSGPTLQSSFLRQGADRPLAHDPMVLQALGQNGAAIGDEVDPWRHTRIWVGVSLNGGFPPPKSSNLIGFSIIFTIYFGVHTKSFATNNALRPLREKGHPFREAWKSRLFDIPYIYIYLV